MNRYKENKSLKKLNEEKTIVALEWWLLNKNWKIKYLNDKYELRDFNLNELQENLQYLVNLRELKISNNYNLQNLDLRNCLNLKNLCLSDNKITEVKLPQNKNKLEHLSIANNNELKKINLEIKIENLEYLNLSSNNKLELKTNMFSKFINLKEMYLSNSNCSGSLFHFRNLTKLKTLWINNTNIIPSFEYLPDNALILLYSIFFNDEKRINKFLTIEDNLLLGRNIDDDETDIKISKFRFRHPQLIENANEIIQLYEYLIEINKNKKYLDSCLNFLENKNEKNRIIKFKIEKEIEKAEFFYSNYNRFIMIYELFSKWIYDENKELRKIINEKNNASLAYYIQLLINKARKENPNLTNEKIQEIQKIEYFPLI